jgi:hypothetical protein
MPDRGNMVAIVGCPNCSAAVKVYQRGGTPSQLAGWKISDEQLCKSPPIANAHLSARSRTPVPGPFRPSAASPALGCDRQRDLLTGSSSLIVVRAMPYSASPDHLRAKARMLRRAATLLNSPLWSDRLRQIASDLDARADAMEGRPVVRDPS